MPLPYAHGWEPFGSGQGRDDEKADKSSLEEPSSFHDNGQTYGRDLKYQQPPQASAHSMLEALLLKVHINRLCVQINMFRDPAASKCHLIRMAEAG